MNLIDFSRSRAILVGTAHYTRGLHEMTAAHNSLQAMRELLTGPLCGWPCSRVTVFEDRTTRDGLDQEIAAFIHSTTDVLLFYYVGHGQLLDGEDLGLALADTHPDPNMRYSTSLRLDVVRAELKDRCRARVRLVILDCCFSGIATRNTQGSGLADQVRVASGVKGAYTLTASRASQKAVYQEGPTGLTYLTKILSEVVRGGIPGAGPELTLKDIHKEVADRFLRIDLADDQLRPEPSVLAIDTAEELVLARNARAAEPVPPPSPTHASPPPQPIPLVAQGAGGLAARTTSPPDSAPRERTRTGAATTPSTIRRRWRRAEPARVQHRVADLLGGVVHVGAVALAAGCFIAANLLPIWSEYWTDESSGARMAQATFTFKLIHPLTRQTPAGPGATTMAPVWIWWLASALGIGTAVVLTLAVLFPALERSANPDLNALAKGVRGVSRLWVYFCVLVVLFAFAMKGPEVSSENPAFDVRVVLGSGAWMLLAASIIVAATLVRTEIDLRRPRAAT